jgi:hypothetical protein
VLGVGAQGAGAVTTLTSLAWCRGPLAKAEVLTPIPTGDSITSVNPSLTQAYDVVNSFTEHATLLQVTAPTSSIANAFGLAVTESSAALEFLSSAEETSSLDSAQSDETWAVTTWSDASVDWVNALDSTKGFCSAVGRSIIYVTQDWVSSCKLPKFILNLRWSNGTTEHITYIQSIPGPWVIKSSSSGSSLPMWVEADWSPGTSSRGVTSTPGTAGGCNEETPGYPYSLSA